MQQTCFSYMTVTHSLEACYCLQGTMENELRVIPLLISINRRFSTFDAYINMKNIDLSWLELFLMTKSICWTLWKTGDSSSYDTVPTALNWKHLNNHIQEEHAFSHQLKKLNTTIVRTVTPGYKQMLRCRF